MNRRAAGVLLFLCLLTACVERKENVAALLRATQVMDDRPDSALYILDSLMADTSRLTTHFLIQCRLHRLNACNNLDTIFTSVNVQQSLVRHFDDEGTPNEQMLAYYLLARAHSDRGEAPAALSSFMQAAERADTLAEDCNFSLLSRVYGQMSSVFYKQNLIQDYLNCLNKSINYAWMGKDTIMAINEYAHKMEAYDRLGNADSVIAICDSVFQRYSSFGYRKTAAQYYGQSIPALLIKGDTGQVRLHMSVYEKESGYFDANNHIEKGREGYYNFKGHYFLSICQYDSSEYYFRKELYEGNDFNNQNGASHGLALLFEKTHKPDSAAKYALYSYDMNDSVYAHMATDKVEQMKALYNYTHHQEAAQKEKERAEHEADKAQRRLYIIVLIVLLACYVTYIIWKKRKRIREEYQKQLIALERMQFEVVKLRTHEANYLALIQEKEEALSQRESEKFELDELRRHAVELNQLIQKKEEIVEQQQNEIAKYQHKEKLEKGNVESLFSKSAIHQLLEEKSNKGQLLTEDEWHEIHKLVIEILPGFYQFISSKQYALNISEYRTCILTRLHVKPSCISSLLDVSPSYISKIRPRIMKKLFCIDGSGKELDAALQEFC